MSFSFADNKAGGRFQAAVDAIAAGHLRKAAGILNEVAEELNVEAEATDGLLAEEEPVEWPVKPITQPELAVKGQPVDMQMCARNVHSYGAPDSNGWRTCASCGNVNVAPPGEGAIDMSARQ